LLSVDTKKTKKIEINLKIKSFLQVVEIMLLFLMTMTMMLFEEDYAEHVLLHSKPLVID
jgi:hypothetical protein